MNREEITSSIIVGRGRSICVLLDRPSTIPGYVRTISLHSENRIQVAFEVEGLDEGGAYFWARYPSLNSAIAALEEFFHKPIGEWEQPYLETLSSRCPAPSHEALTAAIKSGSLLFPPGAKFKLDASYWSQFLPDE